MTRPVVRVSVCVFAAGVAALSWFQSSTVAGAPPPKDITLTPIGVHRTGYFDRGGSEIAAYDPGTRRVFSVNLQDSQVDVLDISDPTNPTALAPIDVSQWGSQANSVAVHDGVVAIAIEAAPKTNPGIVLFTTPSGDFLSVVQVGALPDMLTFTPNGQLVLVANEAEPNSYTGAPTSIDPEGSVSIIDMRDGAANAHAGRRDDGRFRRVQRDGLARSVDSHLRTERDRRAGSRAGVHRRVARFEDGLGHAPGEQRDRHPRSRKRSSPGSSASASRIIRQAGQGLDSSDRDSHTNNITTRPVLGMYQPDGIATFDVNGQDVPHHGQRRRRARVAWRSRTGNTEAVPGADRSDARHRRPSRMARRHH